MAANYTLIKNLAAEISIPENGILSRTLHNDARSKVVGFGFAPGQELSAHTAPMPAVLYFVQGEAALTLGDDQVEAVPGTVVHMEPELVHGVRATSPLIMLLVLIKT